MTRRPNPLEGRARELALAAGLDPDARVAKLGSERGMPAWCRFTETARAEQNKREAAEAAAEIVNLRPQEKRFQNSPLKVFGEHDENTISQMRNCMAMGNAVAGVICADGHLGYAQPVGGVIAYEKQISISGVGFDISCGNAAVCLDTPFADIQHQVRPILEDIWKSVSFGLGRNNDQKIDDPLFDDLDAWRSADMVDYRSKALAQFSSCGTGNHYIDLMEDEAGLVWIGVHFGSRGLGHTSATKYLKLAGGRDGMHVPPAVVDEDSEIGVRYIAAMTLASRYAYAARACVIERVRGIIGGSVLDRVHNNHNLAWKESHVVKGVAQDLWVVRKGATPAFPGQRGFVGGSMGDNAVILEGVDSEEARASLYSTVHGAGRLFGRKQALRTFTQSQMDAWLRERGVLLVGGGLDESPMAYRRLPDVLACHANSIRIVRTLRPFAVAMAAKGTEDPWRD